MMRTLCSILFSLLKAQQASVGTRKKVPGGQDRHPCSLPNNLICFYLSEPINQYLSISQKASFTPDLFHKIFVLIETVILAKASWLFAQRYFALSLFTTIIFRTERRWSNLRSDVSSQAVFVLKMFCHLDCFSIYTSPTVVYLSVN